MPWGVSALLLFAGCAAPAPPPPPVSPFNATDTAWVQLMIPMNEQLLPALDVAPPALADFAAELKASHSDELVHLRQLRDRAGLPDTNPHAGHQMPGLVSEADLLAIRADPSVLTKKLREHLGQTAELARSEQENGTDAATKEFAASVESSRRDQLSRLGHG
ncbi:hypothetical protein [Lentzea flaviverrucosa]|uniref:Uncharacterized conserved protein, DUF305 family n=1 Tax=Lentzea flaviverrucosa TaxID=200379 RepID=A0A1H9D1R1_9PSEU|nr:hypothetical protein [Lentzea flaviverrucosa]RDI24719.1 uncharacterized protein (DUF305 family) [Lentzea flaviverrucosa]SEQ07395.1 Uncharacterized conserved protein, DUF305 family [Lentzea flaviverrucosa]